MPSEGNRHVSFTRSGVLRTLPNGRISGFPGYLTVEPLYAENQRFIPQNTPYVKIDAENANGNHEPAVGLDIQKTITQLSEDWLHIMLGWKNKELSGLPTTLLIAETNPRMAEAAKLLGFISLMDAQGEKMGRDGERIMFDLKSFDDDRVFNTLRRKCELAISLNKYNSIPNVTFSIKFYCI